MSITATVHLDPKLFWRLAEVAERHDMRVDEYLAELAAQAALRRGSDGLDCVTVRWRRGWTDKQIAADLGWTNEAVATKRRALGFPPNKRTRGQAA